VAPHPQFATNRLLYITYAKPQPDGQSTTALIRARFENDRLSNIQPLFESVSKGQGHYGGKIAFDGKGFLYLTLGDRQVPPEGNLEAHPAQDLTNHHGKLIRLHDDGRVPADNPFVARQGARPEIWSYGHRNVQGIAINPATGDVWTDEHGPQGGDELNLIIGEEGPKPGFEHPLKWWVAVSVAPSGLAFVTGDRYPGWKGSLMMGMLRGMGIARLTLDGQRVTGEERLLGTLQARIRDVRQGPDGWLYVLTDGVEGQVLRLER